MVLVSTPHVVYPAQLCPPPFQSYVSPPRRPSDTVLFPFAQSSNVLAGLERNRTFPCWADWRIGAALK